MEDAQKQPVEVDFKVNLAEPPQKKEETVEEPTEEVQATEEEKAEVSETETKTEAEASEEVIVEETTVEKTREELLSELLKDKYNIEPEELENVLTKKETQELPADVEKYLEYRKETNRSMEDFLRLQRDFSEVPEGELLREFYRQTKQGLDDKDIESLIDLKYGYDKGAEESVVTSKKLELKEELYRAKQFFEGQKDKYRKPLESSEVSLPDEAKEAVEFYQLYKKQQDEQAKHSESVRKTFEEKTSKLFNDEFKGFEFKIGEEKVVFKPKDVMETKKAQSNLNNFIAAHTDENGVLLDAKKYHTALSMAMNPEAYAKFFYEQGKASAIDNVIADGKNIDMSVRSNCDSQKPGTKFRVVNDDSRYMSGLRIKKR